MGINTTTISSICSIINTTITNITSSSTIIIIIDMMINKETKDMFIYLKYTLSN